MPKTIIDVVVAVLAEDKEIIPYRKSLRSLAGTVTSTILLQQMIFRAKSANFESFYKFKAPCNHNLYRPGDSWTEELGFSIKEFTTALIRIGTKSKKGSDKATLMNGSKVNELVIYWIDQSRITWYWLNYKLLCSLLSGIYLSDQTAFRLSDQTAFSKVTKDNLPSLQRIPENTREKTALSPDNGTESFKVQRDPLTDIFFGQGQVENKLSQNPVPDDAWLTHGDLAIEIYARLCGSLGQTSEERATRKNIILGFASEQNPFLPKLWEQSIEQSIGAGVGLRNLTRFIEVYKVGGRYQDWLKKEYPNKSKASQSGTSQLERQIW